MNREIKFRAWDERVNEMIKHDFAIVGENGRVYVSDEKNSRDYITLLQFTGLQDIKGKDIYEADLIRFNETGPIHEVVFLEDGHWYAKCLSNTNCFYLSAVYKIMNIVSNVYEFPELLRNEQNPERSLATEAK